MKEPSSILDVRRQAIRTWLLTVAALIFVMVLVGGATRVTESGLSIVEWRPVTGVLPPLSTQGWQIEFQKYQGTPQYQRVNRGMTLGEFKTIYWWEWAHRLLGRVIGVAFVVPFGWYWWRGWIEPPLRARLLGLLGLGALQGVVGWWMVVSGLSDRVEVSQYRLATHLLLACVIFGATVWTAQGLAKRVSEPVPRRLQVEAIILAGLILLQIYLGALVAGVRAGLIYNTWPLIDGALIPSGGQLFFNVPAWRNFFENALLVQFDHRMLAYLVWTIACLHAIDVARVTLGGARKSAVLLLAAITLQAALGIFTLVYQVPAALALAHQGMAMIVLALSAAHAERLFVRRFEIPSTLVT